jgi:HAE1 family hydrophobic/amphiphilic exporter-1
MRITMSAIRRPVGVTVFSAVALILGTIAVLKMPVDLLPSVEYPRLTVETTYPPSSPFEVERLVTDPLEQSLAGIRGLRSYTSRSYGDRSRITLEFGWGTRMDFARLEVREKLDVAGWSLPDEAGRPTLVEYDPSRRPFMEILVAREGDWTETTDFVRRVVTTRIEQVDGVAACEIEGGAEAAVYVRLREDALEELGISPAMVSMALAGANARLPGGLVREGQLEYFLSLEGQFENLTDVAETVVGFRGSTPVILGDIAEISLTEKPPTGWASCDGERCIILRVRKMSGGNTVEIAGRVGEVLAELAGQYPDIRMEVLQNDAVFISESIDGVIESLVMGALLAFGILFLFLRDWRSPVIMGISIPLSIAVALFALYMSGITLNIMSLGGLALGTGLLVDNSIVVLEAVHRRREKGEGPLEAAVGGTGEVAGAIVASTLTTLVVFFPVVYLEGVTSQLFRDQALAVSFALVASLLVAITVVPLLASRSKAAAGRTDPTARLREWYATAASSTLRRPSRVVAVSAGLAVAAVLVGGVLPRQLLPAVPVSELDITFSAPEGTSVPEIAAFSDRASDLAARAGAVRISGRSGVRSVEGVDAFLTAEFDSPEAASRAMSTIPRAWQGSHVFALNAVPHETLLGEILGGGGAFTVYLECEDVGAGLEAAEALAGEVRSLDGVEGVEVGYLPGNPEILLRLDQELSALLGMEPGEVADWVESMARGLSSTTYYRQDERVDVMVLSDEGEGVSLEQILQRSTPVAGILVPLERLVSVERRQLPGYVEHYQGNRAVSISISSSGGNLAGLSSDVTSTAGVSLSGVPVTLRTGPEVEEMDRTTRSLLLAALLAAGLVYVLMAAQFESFKGPFVIMFTVPLGLVGVVAALALTGQSWNALSGIGVVILSGIVVNDGILLVERIRQIRAEGVPLEEAIVQAGRDRLRPVLMTSVTTILGLLPMAVGIGTGGTLRQPLAIAVIGGMTVATVLTLFLVPAIYKLMSAREG